MTFVKYFLFLYTFLICFAANSQLQYLKVGQIKKSKTYEDLLQKLDEDTLSKKSANDFAREYLAKAKAESNWEETVTGYKILLHQADSNDRIFYADSMINAAKLSVNNDLIAASFLTKGILYYDVTDFNNALNNYLIADNYASETTDQYLRFKIWYNIAQIKYYLGFYDEALKLFQQCVQYFKNGDDIPYLTSLHSMGLCYIRLEKYDLSIATNKLGIKEATRLGHLNVIPRFINSDGINHFFKKNYTVSIAQLNETLPYFKKSKDFAGETVTNFYLGKNYLALKQNEKAIPYFLKVDKAFIEKNYIYPHLRETFEILINYYKNKKDIQNQLIYIDHLFLVDQYLNSNYKYLSTRIAKEYDTKELVQAKKEIENTLKSNQRLSTFYIIIISILSVSLAYIIYNSRENKRKFKKLMDRKPNPPVSIEKQEENLSTLNIKPEVVSMILKQLEKFETNKKFLMKDISLPKMAKMFNSNIVYVSKIIAFSRQKKSTHYINDLRIEYVMDRIKTSSMVRSYKNSGLAEEGGFKTTQHFTRAFVRYTGIAPTYFVQEIKKAIDSGKPV